VRSPSSPLADTTVSFIFFATVPDRKPRMLCGCQPVAFINSLAVAPSGPFSRSRIFAALVPSRAPAAFFALVGAFLAGLVVFPDFAFLGAAFARRLPGVAFLVGFAKTLSSALFPFDLVSMS